MPTNVILPALGMAQDTGKIVEWLKAEGDRVTAGEPLVTIETDKAAVDLEAPATGILSGVSAQAGEEVPVAQVIAVILSPDEAAQVGGDTAGVAGVAGVAASTSAQQPTHVAVTAAAGAHRENGQRSHMAEATSANGALAPARNGRRAASPKARRIAAERGVDIAALRGSGPGGVVLAADVLEASVPAAALSAPVEMPTIPAAPVIAAAPAAQTTAVSANGQGKAEAGESATSAVWRLMAERTTQSWTTVPHFFLVREVEAGELLAWHEREQQRASEKLTLTDLLVKAAAEALRRHPRLNATWQNGAISLSADAHIGIAVATEDGLVVPVIHQAGDLTLNAIARRRADLVARAQAGKLRLPDLQGGTFTISNLGMYGVDAFTAIINAPQAAILAVGRVVDRVVPVAGQPAVRPMLTLSLSCDHRVVDGARGARFLATLAELIEDPSCLPG